jgi:hypothetical protein
MNRLPAPIPKSRNTIRRRVNAYSGPLAEAIGESDPRQALRPPDRTVGRASATGEAEGTVGVK